MSAEPQKAEIRRWIPGSEVVESSVAVPRKLEVSRMLESEDGDWVHFDDVAPLVQELEDLRAKYSTAVIDCNRFVERAESAERRLEEARKALRQFMPTVRSHPAPDSDEIRSTGAALSRLHEAVFPEQYVDEAASEGSGAASGPEKKRPAMEGWIAVPPSTPGTDTSSVPEEGGGGSEKLDEIASYLERSGTWKWMPPYLRELAAQQDSLLTKESVVEWLESDAAFDAIHGDHIRSKIQGRLIAAFSDQEPSKGDGES